MTAQKLKASQSLPCYLCAVPGKDERCSTSICGPCGEKLLAQVTELKDELRRMTELRQHGCECSDDDACQFARDRDTAQAEAKKVKSAMGKILSIASDQDCSGCHEQDDRMECKEYFKKKVEDDEPNIFGEKITNEFDEYCGRCQIYHTAKGFGDDGGTT